MIQGHFYYLDEQYYNDFNDPNIQRNHETINGITHDKPCFCAIEGDNGIFWLIPISSKIDKYHKLADAKIQKHHKCDTILFGNVLGHEKAFLIQNMIPATEKYIKNEYLDQGSQCVRVDNIFQNELIRTAKKFYKSKGWALS